MPVQPSLVSKILEIPQRALQDWHVDVFAVQIGVVAGASCTVMTGLQHHVDGLSQLIDQFHERCRAARSREDGRP